MKVTAYEMSKAFHVRKVTGLPDFDPIAKGYVNTANSYKVATYTLKNKYFKIYLNKRYTAKDGTQYINHGAYLMTMYDHPQYLQEQLSVCPQRMSGLLHQAWGGYRKRSQGKHHAAGILLERWKNIKSWDGLRDSTEKRNYSTFFSTQAARRPTT